MFSIFETKIILYYHMMCLINKTTQKTIRLIELIRVAVDTEGFAMLISAKGDGSDLTTGPKFPAYPMIRGIVFSS